MMQYYPNNGPPRGYDNASELMGGVILVVISSFFIFRIWPSSSLRSSRSAYYRS